MRRIKITHYFLLPHYEANDNQLVFLGRYEVPLSPDETTVLSKVLSGDNLCESEAVLQLVEKGIIIEAETRDTKPAKKAILVPHSDDAALSLGGYLLQDRRFCIWNIFSTCPASINLQSHNLTPEEVTFYNNLEEMLYASIVGAPLIFFGIQEALQRGYSVFDQKFMIDAERDLMEHLFDRIVDTARSTGIYTLYVPLSMGNNVDHVILFNLGLRLAARKQFEVFFYEDQPYTEEVPIPEFERQLEEKTTGMVVAEIVNITDFMARKIELATIYKTQYDKNYLQKLSDYAWRIGTHYPIERIWRLKE